MGENSSLDNLPAAVRLRDDLDVGRLRADLTELGRQQEWAQQRPFADGSVSEPVTIDWRCLSLRSPGGDPDRTDPGGPGRDKFADTAWMAKAPYLAQVLAELDTELRSVRLMALAPSVKVPEHRDFPIGLPYGFVRLHVPVVTNPDAVLVLDGVEHRWQPGTLWYADFDRPHSVFNTGDSTRVHLVADCAVTSELMAHFPDHFRNQLAASEVAFQRPAIPLSTGELDDFRCRFAIPKSFVEWGDPVQDDAATDLAAEVTVADGELVLLVAGGPAVGLVHVGASEFRLQGWSEERGLRLQLFDPTPHVVFHTRRGRRRQEVTRLVPAAAGC